MGWRGRGGGRAGLWPGGGPFSYLPPWQRPGWLYGRGACWWLLSPYQTTTQASAGVTPVPPTASIFTKEQESLILEQQVKALEAQLDAVKKRLEELKTEK